MVCQECDVCEYPNIFGCYDRDYDCDNGCDYCFESDECKYESGELGASIYAFNKLVEDGSISYNPFIKLE